MIQVSIKLPPRRQTFLQNLFYITCLRPVFFVKPKQQPEIVTFHLLLTSQTPYRVRHSCFYRLITYCKNRDDHR